MSAPKSIIEGLRRMIRSHVANDEGGFAHGAEAIIQEFVLSNHPREANELRQIVRSAAKNGVGIASHSPLPLPSSNRSGDALLRLRNCRVTRESIILSPEAREILDRVATEYAAAKLLAEHGLISSRRLLFWGPPGCGKTLAAQHLASELNLPLGTVRLGSLVSSYLGETASNLQKVFAQAEQVPMVLLLDEVDAIAASRTSPNDVGELRRIVNGLLQCLDEVATTRSIVVLATNHQHLFDVAVWRRFDEVVEFCPPDGAIRRSYLRMLVSGIRVSGSLASVVEATSGMSFADIERAVKGIQKKHVLEGSAAMSIAEISKAAKGWRRKIARAAGRLRSK